MNAKKYVTIVVITCIFFIFYHITIWYFYTSQVFQPKLETSIGDLGRMSYQVDMLHSRKLMYTLEKKHLNKSNFVEQKIDILTIGDSFSNGDALGENPYYQDFLATQFQLNVLNISKSKNYNAMETIIGLYNSGYLAKIQPKSIIIESVERLLVSRYAKNINFNLTNVQVTLAPLVTKIPHIPLKLINTANYKLPYYYVKYKFNNHGEKHVYRFQLNKQLFSIKDGKDILIFKDDISNSPKITYQNVKQINDNFNKLAILLKNLNIKLYFMPAVDKFDLYYSYIVQNRYSQNKFFDIIRPLEKKYYFVDTKEILTPLLKVGIKDVYWTDDTHWTQKASKKIISNNIFQHIN